MNFVAVRQERSLQSQSPSVDPVRRVMAFWLKAFLVIWAAALLLHEVPIGGRWFPVHGVSWALLLGWIALFSLGYRFAGARQVREVNNRVTAQTMATAATVCAIVSAVGAALVIFDFGVLRHYGFSTSAATIRAIETQAFLQGNSTSSPISGIGRLAIPAILPGLVIVTGTREILKLQHWLIVGISCLLLLYEQLFFEGGRSFIACALLVAIVTSLTRSRLSAQEVRRKRRPGARIWLMASLPIALFYFASVFVVRIMERDDFFWSAYRSFASSFQIYVDTPVVARFEGVLGPAWFSLSMFWLYITQGINEMDQVVQIQNLNLAYGIYQVPQIAQVASLLFGVDIRYDTVVNLPNTGTFLTLPGANYVDFGVLGVVCSALITGYFTAMTMHALASDRAIGIALCGPIMVTVAMFAPVASVITIVLPALIWSLIVGLVLRSKRPG